MSNIRFALHGFGTSHPHLAQRWDPPDSRHVGDADELRRRVLDLLDGIGDAGAWNSERHKNLVREAIAAGLVEQGDVDAALARHGLSRDPLVAAGGQKGLVTQ
jgi:hypothetical protein